MGLNSKYEHLPTKAGQVSVVWSFGHFKCPLFSGAGWRLREVLHTRDKFFTTDLHLLPFCVHVLSSKSHFSVQNSLCCWQGDSTVIVHGMRCTVPLSAGVGIFRAPGVKSRRVVEWKEVQPGVTMNKSTWALWAQAVS